MPTRAATAAAARSICEALTFQDCLRLVMTRCPQAWIRIAACDHPDFCLLGEVVFLQKQEWEWWGRRFLVGTPAGRCAVLTIMPRPDELEWCMAIVSADKPVPTKTTVVPTAAPKPAPVAARPLAALS